MARKRKWLKRGIGLIVVLFILVNIIAIFQGYRFTHYSPDNAGKTAAAASQNFLQKINTLVLGVKIPRPENTDTPKASFQTIRIKSNKEIACWLIKTTNAKGTVILFHGYTECKSALLKQAAIFRNLGYNTLLVDFMGSGGSEGNQTTIGYFEAEEVKSCFDYLQQKGVKNIYLYGISMGAAAIMKALHDYPIAPKAIILECPFGSLYHAVVARFKLMGVPAFPLAGILAFWGGAENGFWTFDFQPSRYAKNIHCPTLLMYGGKDPKVSRTETDKIFQNLAGKKTLKIFPDAGHAHYLTHYKKQWQTTVAAFLKEY